MVQFQERFTFSVPKRIAEPKISMLEKPDLKDEKIIACLDHQYGLMVRNIDFLPIGADFNTVVYRAVANDGKRYFLKLRLGEIPTSLTTVPKFLSDLGIRQVIPPLATRTGQLWAEFHPYKMILSPLIEGHSGFEQPLSDRDWVEFGRLLRKFHSADIPQRLTKDVPSESFSDRWRESVKMFLARIQKEDYPEPIAAQMAAYLNSKRDEIYSLIERSEQLSRIIQPHPSEFILCHADIHVGNLLIADTGEIYIVDWDTLMFAPKERDLMFIGGGLSGGSHTPEEETKLFYQGYGETNIDSNLLAYYRYERILEDIAVYCEKIILSKAGGEDRQQSFEFLKSNFLPNGTLELASRSDPSLKAR